VSKTSILITGAGKGIGLEIARQLAGRGCTVWLTARDEKRGEKAARSLSGDVHFLRMDVSDHASIRVAVEQVSSLDVLINNAAVLLDGDADLPKLKPNIVRETFESNVFAPLFVAQAFVPQLRKSKRPRIINISSGGGQLSEPSTWAPAYCISKTALNGVTVGLSAALPDFAVNSVCPGWVRTDMGGSAAPRSVEQGADTAVWLALDAPQTLTGKFLRDREVIPW
jgi:NAD(P)-dependent dehydrogenase (short-subunit alcohol dehydrogenase family)